MISKIKYKIKRFKSRYNFWPNYNSYNFSSDFINFSNHDFLSIFIFLFLKI